MQEGEGRLLGPFVRRRRSELGLTQTALARSIGRHKGTVSAIEQGARGGVSRPTLVALDEALRWQPGSAERLLEGTGEAVNLVDPLPASTSVSRDLLALVNEIEQLEPRRRRLAIDQCLALVRVLLDQQAREAAESD